MLNGSDVQLFYKLLDSLSTSLRDLAVKYELLLRDSTERDKVASAVASVAKEISSTFAVMSRDIDSLKKMMSDSSQHNDEVMSSVQTGIKSIEGLDAKVGQALRDIGAMSSGMTSATDGVKHLDGHMDETHGDLKELLGISQTMAAMITAVEEMKNDFAPIKKLSLLMSKPAAIIVGVYVIVTTVLSVMKGCEEWKKAGERPVAKVVTNSVAAARHPGQ